ncbi:MAG TPA: paraquat-inducible protein A, partial [Burkholderiales bacterium]|nr:paraquat-inducible protein A [Burkholderiales bacterium]
MTETPPQPQPAQPAGEMHQQLMPAETLTACGECDLLQRIPPLPPGGKARCSRCGFTLATRPSHTIEVPLALALTAAIAFLVANATPLMGLSAVGRRASTTIIGGAWQMWVEGEPITAAIVAFCVVIAPALYLLFVIVVLVAARRLRVPRWTGEILRWGLHLLPWSMYEVMMLGVLVSLIKIAELATVEAGIGMYAIGVLMMLFPAIAVTFDPQEVWKRVEWA